MTVSHKTMLQNLVGAITAREYEEVFLDRDNAQHIGATLDELVRHHPTLRPIMLEAILQLIHSTLESAATFEPEELEAAEYATIIPPSEPFDPKSNAPTNAHLVAFEKIFKVSSLDLLSTNCQVLEGLLRNSALSKEFVSAGGFDLVIRFLESSCVPLKFIGTSNAAMTLSNLLRTVGDHDHVQLVVLFTKAIDNLMTRCSALWQGSDAIEKWSSVAYNTTDDLDLKALRGLANCLAYLTEAIGGQSWTQGRVVTGLIKALGVAAGKDLVPRLGTLHRVCLQQHVISKDSVETHIPSIHSAMSFTAVDDASRGAFEDSSKPVPDPDTATENTFSSPKISLAKLLATRTHGILTKLFKCKLGGELD